MMQFKLKKLGEVKCINYYSTNYDGVGILLGCWTTYYDRTIWNA